MTTKLTEESRYWSAMIPCLALGALAIRPPGHRWFRQAFLLASVLFLMFCCARFSGTYRSLWYATPAGLYLQQSLLAAGLLVGIYHLHRIIRRFWTNDRRTAAHLLAIVFCGILACAYWKFGNAPKPLVAFMPLLTIGLMMSVPMGLPNHRALLCTVLSLLPLGATWYLGRWSRDDIALPQIEYYARDGVLVKLTSAEKRARGFVARGGLPRLFASNVAEQFSDLFEPHAEIPLCSFPDEGRFRAGRPQDPQQEQEKLSAWVEQLSQARLNEPIVIIYLPEILFRTRFYGPATLERLGGFDVRWEVRQEDLHIAICTLIDKS